VSCQSFLHLDSDQAELADAFGRVAKILARKFDERLAEVGVSFPPSPHSFTHHGQVDQQVVHSVDGEGSAVNGFADNR
jgi:hypothetical protein